MSKLPFFYYYLSVGNLKPKLKPKFVLLNLAPVAAGGRAGVDGADEPAEGQHPHDADDGDRAGDGGRAAPEGGAGRAHLGRNHQRGRQERIIL